MFISIMIQYRIEQFCCSDHTQAHKLARMHTHTHTHTHGVLPISENSVRENTIKPKPTIDYVHTHRHITSL